MSIRRAFLPSALGLALALLGRPVAACSCVYVPDQDHACVSYPHTSSVFSGRVASVSVVRSNDEWQPRRRVFHLEILEGFSGVDGTAVDVATGMGGGDCGFDFETGQSYLVYAHRLEDGSLSTSICSRTRSLDQAAADLDHARRIASGKPQVRLFGKVEHVQRTGMDSVPTWEGLQGIQIIAEGPGGESFAAVTDEDGRFEIRDRLSGPFAVRAVLSEGSPPAASQEVVVPAGGCAGAVLQVSVLGRLQGRVVEADGKSPQSLRLSLIPVRGKPENASAGDIYIREDGTFEAREVPPGDYLLAVNPNGPSLYGPPYPPTFYPAASTPEGALPITVRPSETVELRDLQLPPRLVERTVSGQVRRYDGQPATGASGVRIRVIGPDGRESVSNGTDESGRFTLQGYEGYRYGIAAERRFRSWATCSARVEVEIGSENEPIDLVLDRFSTAPAHCLPDA
jgi:hypothetical protein